MSHRFNDLLGSCSNTRNPKYYIKCVMLGCSGSGKSSIVIRYVANRFDPHSYPTIGAAYNSRTIESPDGFIKLDIWDTAGQERFASMAPLYCRHANVTMIIFDVTSTESYETAKKRISTVTDECQTSPIIFLVGNKTDLEDIRTITKHEAQAYASSVNVTYFECSAKSGVNVNVLFEKACEYFVEQIKQNKNSVKIDVGQTINLESETNASLFASCMGWITSHATRVARYVKPSDTKNP
jgi:Ras-related protein Rab-5C